MILCGLAQIVHQHTILNFLDGISDMSDQRDRGRRVPLILHQPQDFCLDHGLAVCVATWHREVAAAATRGVNAGFLFIGTASGFGIFFPNLVAGTTYIWRVSALLSCRCSSPSSELFTNSVPHHHLRGLKASRQIVIVRGLLFFLKWSPQIIQTWTVLFFFKHGVWNAYI